MLERPRPSAKTRWFTIAVWRGGRVLLSLAAFLLPSVCLADDEDRPSVITVVGAPGLPEFGGQFREWADRWQGAAKKAGAPLIRIGLDSQPAKGEKGPTDRDRLQTALTEQAKDLKSSAASRREPLWLVLIGHGTFDGKQAKLNLRGPDVTDAELAQWLAPIKRPLVLIDCTSASGPFLSRLSGQDRVIVTATRSGDEQNFARFGQYMAESIEDERSDLDKDGQVSLLEAFLSASGRTAEWYRSKSQLATEHPLIDDNGDRLGTPADWFRGIRATRRAKDGAPLDGIRAHQIHLMLSDRERRIPTELRSRRDTLERSIADLRDQKSKLSENDYYAKLEPLMTELARLYAGSSDTEKRP